MNNVVLALGALALLASCSSEPSDYRPGKKVSDDAVYAGGRPTGIYPSNDESNASHRGAGHGEHGAVAHGEHAGHGTEMHAADASVAAATGDAHQQSGTGDRATPGASPEEKAAADSAERAEEVKP